MKNKQIFEPINYSRTTQPKTGEELINGYNGKGVIPRNCFILDESNDNIVEPDTTSNHLTGLDSNTFDQNSFGSFGNTCTDSGCSSENVSTSSESFGSSFQVFHEMLLESKTKSPVEQKKETNTSSHQDSQGTSIFEKIAFGKLHNNCQSENCNPSVGSPIQSPKAASCNKIANQTSPRSNSEEGNLEGRDKPDIGSSKGYVKDNLEEIQSQDGRTSNVLSLYSSRSSSSFHDSKSDDEDEPQAASNKFISDTSPSESSYESSSDELVIDESHDNTDKDSTYFGFASRHLQTIDKDDVGFSDPKKFRNVDEHSGKHLHSHLQTNRSHYPRHPFENEYSLGLQKTGEMSNLQVNFSPRSPCASSQEEHELNFPLTHSTNINFLIERSMKMHNGDKGTKRPNDEANCGNIKKKQKYNIK